MTVLIAENFASRASGGAPRLPIELAERWGVTLETLARVEELAKQVDTVYQEWVKSRDSGGKICV